MRSKYSLLNDDVMGQVLEDVEDTSDGSEDITSNQLLVELARHAAGKYPAREYHEEESDAYTSLTHRASNRAR